VSAGPVARVTRARKDRIIGGVCAGLAEHFGWSVNKLRAAYVVVSLLSAAFPGILVYCVLWYLMPDAPPRQGFELRDPGTRQLH
jgi:phage shock protein C